MPYSLGDSFLQGMVIEVSHSCICQSLADFSLHSEISLSCIFLYTFTSNSFTYFSSTRFLAFTIACIFPPKFSHKQKLSLSLSHAYLHPSFLVQLTLLPHFSCSLCHIFLYCIRSTHAHILPYHPDFLLMYCNTIHSTFRDVLSLILLFNINFTRLNFSFSKAGACVSEVAISMARRGI